LDFLETYALRPLKALQAMAHRHPRRLSASLLAVLGGFAVAAFGIAPMAPDAALLPQHLVTESVTVPGLDRQAEDLAFHDLDLWRSDVTRSTDTAGTLLKRLAVTDPAASIYLRNDRYARRVIEGSGGKMVQARTARDGSLLQLVARFPAADEAQARTHFTRLTIERVNGQFTSQVENVPLSIQPRMGSGAIRSTLFAATDDAGLPDSIASQLIDLFSTEIDFHRELHKGDSFSVVYEGLVADGLPIAWSEGTGRILAAEFRHNGRTSQALWFVDPASGTGGYFDFNGRSKRRGFLASPVAFSRVTSGFAMRLHPILQTWRAHNGVDYAAPTGTPAKAVGDGIVESAGWNNGYGNVVEIRHGGDKSTVYAHLSKIIVKKGQRVTQGQEIGLVGATGWATGPHLHFEFRVAGQFQDPLTIARQAETVTVDARAKPQFQSVAMTSLSRLSTADALRGYRGDTE
jgi:murein DD-endopeptidase MepM/ murein hydrolase activator NlpD